MSVAAMLAAHKLAVRTTHACYRVLMCLAEHADDAGLNAWPSIDTIAAEAQADEKTVRRSLAKLEADGMIVGKRGRGRSNTTVWSLNFSVAPLGKEGTMPANAPVEPEAKEGTMPPIEPLKEGIVPVKPGILSVKPGTMPPEPVLNLSRTSKSSLRSPRARGSGIERGFEIWWQAYPRKVGKDAARRSYEAAVKRGATPEALLDAVRRQRWPEELRFTPHPATWLNAGSWQDDPAAAAPPQHARGPPPRRETREEERRRKLGLRSILDFDQPVDEETDHEPPLAIARS